MGKKITYHNDDFKQEVEIQTLNNNQSKKLEIIETQDGGGIPNHLKICKVKGENAITINGIRLECEVYQILITILKDEFY